MADHSKMKLGRREIKRDPRTLHFRKYCGPELPTAPAVTDWSAGIADWGMMLNDQLGDCTIAGCGHAVQAWSKLLGAEITIPDSTILQYYEQWDGYNPSDPSTDQGGIELDVLTNWRKSEFSGHKLIGYAAANHHNLSEIKSAIHIFGGVYIGVELPVSAQDQDVWDVVHDDGGDWGGHCVWVTGYDEHTFTCVTWGALKKLTVAFWKKYVDEAYALLSQDWIGANGSPAGLNMEQLNTDLCEVR